MWNVPLNTHRYLIEPLAGKHAKVMIYERYINFIKTVQNSKKLPVKYMYERIKDDTRSITGSNIREILILYDKDNILDINTKHIKNQMKFCEIPKEEEWRINLIKELTDVKQKNLNIDNNNETFMNNDQIDDLIYIAATS